MSSQSKCCLFLNEINVFALKSILLTFAILCFGYTSWSQEETNPNNKNWEEVQQAKADSALQNYRKMLVTYDSLTKADQSLADSLELQKHKISHLIDEMDSIRMKNKITASELDNLKKKNASLRAVMANYVHSIDSLNKEDLRLKKTLNVDLRPFYYRIEDFDTPKVFHFENAGLDDLMSFWKVESDQHKNGLIITVMDKRGHVLEVINQSFDSIGVKLIGYQYGEGLANSSYKGELDEIYRWKGKTSYSVKVIFPVGLKKTYSLIKTRTFLRLDSLEVMGTMREVSVFRDVSNFENLDVSNSKPSDYTVLSFFAKGLGCVKIITESGEDRNMKLTEIISVDLFESRIRQMRFEK